MLKSISQSRKECIFNGMCDSQLYIGTQITHLNQVHQPKIKTINNRIQTDIVKLATESNI